MENQVANVPDVALYRDISHTDLDSLYWHPAFGERSYKIAVPDASASYKVRIHFAEIYYTGDPALEGYAARGESSVNNSQRRFNVFIEGNPLLKNFDITAAAGNAVKKAVVKEFLVNPEDGFINIDFEAIVSNPIFAAIEVLSAEYNEPLLLQAIPDQQAMAGLPFDFTLYPDQHFHNYDIDHELEYEITPSPNSWLRYDSLTNRFYGTPSAIDTLPVQVNVTAWDFYGGSTHTQFAVQVAPSPYDSLSYRLNAGRVTDYTTPNGITFFPDTTVFTGGSILSTTDSIGCTVAPTIYQSNRNGQDFSYQIPVASSGDYNVILHMANIDPVVPGLTFSAALKNFCLDSGDSLGFTQILTTNAPGALPVSIQASGQPSWLSLNGTSLNNAITHDLSADTILNFQINTSGLDVGEYQTTISATGEDIQTARFEVHLVIADRSGLIQVNFQPEAIIPPSGWLRDFGQAYGARTDDYQGVGLSYGWSATNGTPCGCPRSRSCSFKQGYRYLKHYLDAYGKP